MSNKVNNSNRDSKSNLLHLSFSTPMSSLEAQAARAALIAQAQASLPQADKTPEQRSPHRGRILSQLERQLKNIRDAFKRTDLTHTVVTFSRPTDGSSAVCVITTSDKDEDKGGKRTFVFYPSVTDPDRLGSVAIYGYNVQMECGSLLRRGSLFGLQIGSVSVEMGRRPFLDVTFRG